MTEFWVGETAESTEYFFLFEFEYKHFKVYNLKT